VIVLAVLAGGMLGAPARYLADRAVQARHDSVFPWGTFAVNMAGSAVLGFLLGLQRHAGLPPAVFALLGTGLCGGLTTCCSPGSASCWPGCCDLACPRRPPEAGPAVPSVGPPGRRT
jgi:fluoride ion exporter CrcB/FEX